MDRPEEKEKVKAWFENNYDLFKQKADFVESCKYYYISLTTEQKSNNIYCDVAKLALKCDEYKKQHRRFKTLLAQTHVSTKKLIHNIYGNFRESHQNQVKSLFKTYDTASRNAFEQTNNTTEGAKTTFTYFLKEIKIIFKEPWITKNFNILSKQMTDTFSLLVKKFFDEKVLHEINVNMKELNSEMKMDSSKQCNVSGASINVTALSTDLDKSDSPEIFKKPEQAPPRSKNSLKRRIKDLIRCLQRRNQTIVIKSSGKTTKPLMADSISLPNQEEFIRNLPLTHSTSKLSSGSIHEDSDSSRVENKTKPLTEETIALPNQDDFIRNMPLTHSTSKLSSGSIHEDSDSSRVENKTKPLTEETIALPNQDDFIRNMPLTHSTSKLSSGSIHEDSDSSRVENKTKPLTEETIALPNQDDFIRNMPLTHSTSKLYSKSIHEDSDSSRIENKTKPLTEETIALPNQDDFVRNMPLTHSTSKSSSESFHKDLKSSSVEKTTKPLTEETIALPNQDEFIRNMPLTHSTSKCNLETQDHRRSDDSDSLQKQHNEEDNSLQNLAHTIEKLKLEVKGAESADKPTNVSAPLATSTVQNSGTSEMPSSIRPESVASYDRDIYEQSTREMISQNLVEISLSPIKGPCGQKTVSEVSNRPLVTSTVKTNTNSSQDKSVNKIGPLATSTTRSDSNLGSAVGFKLLETQLSPISKQNKILQDIPVPQNYFMLSGYGHKSSDKDTLLKDNSVNHTEFVAEAVQLAQSTRIAETASSKKIPTISRLPVSKIPPRRVIGSSEAKENIFTVSPSTKKFKDEDKNPKKPSGIARRQ